MTKKKLPGKAHTHRSAQDMLKEIEDLKSMNERLKALIRDILNMLEKKL